MFLYFKINLKLYWYVSRCGQHINRYQLPFTIAYAMSIHKCQGVSVDQAIITTKGAFAAAQVYVAYSRVRTAAGLFLMDFNMDNILTSKHALGEYNKLRRHIGQPPLCDPRLTRVPQFNVFAKLENEARRERATAVNLKQRIDMTCVNITKSNLEFATLVQCILLIDGAHFWNEVCYLCTICL